MRINEVNGSHAIASLDADDLVWLHNILYFYETNYGAYPDYKKPDAAFHQLAKQVATARDLCQYGHLDGHALGVIAAHELAANPDGRLAGKLKKLQGSEGACPGQDG